MSEDLLGGNAEDWVRGIVGQNRVEAVVGHAGFWIEKLNIFSCNV